ncbi:MAG: nicotinate phosphoribosyltransferase [Acidobacteriota bacterium]
MKPQLLYLTGDNHALCTDLYELTMAAAYFQAGVREVRATFELFTRELPPHRNFFLAAGLEQALAYLSELRFSGEDIDYLRSLPVFENCCREFFEYLREFRFTGDVWALPEGTPFFADEPVLQVEAPVIEAQLVETYLINIVNVQTMVATKAARLVACAGGKPVVDFGSRRAHGPHTAVLAARAAYIGGCAGTSNVLAGRLLGIPVFGTMAHSFVQFFADEAAAFAAFARVFGANTTLLVDTYDIRAGIERAARFPGEIAGIRIDSGNLVAWAKEARRVLDTAGRRQARILTSGSLHEADLLRFRDEKAPVDGYGVGTELVVSSDAPGCDLVYKLVQVQHPGNAPEPRFKASPGKETWPYRKQIFRRSQGGRAAGDLLARYDEIPGGMFQDARPLLRQVMAGGEICGELPGLEATKEYAAAAMAELPEPVRDPCRRACYPVEVSEGLQEARRRLLAEHVGNPGPGGREEP